MLPAVNQFLFKLLKFLICFHLSFKHLWNSIFPNFFQLLAFRFSLFSQTFFFNFLFSDFHPHASASHSYLLSNLTPANVIVINPCSFFSLMLEPPWTWRSFSATWFCPPRTFTLAIPSHEIIFASSYLSFNSYFSFRYWWFIHHF